MSQDVPGQIFYQGVGHLDRTFLATLYLLAQEGKANVRAAPRLLARCGSAAAINIRRTNNFFYVSGTDYQGHPVSTRSDVSADIVMKITPQVLASNRIAMAVDATVDSFIFSGTNDLPNTTRRQAVTDVVCEDGATLVIGGLAQEEQNTTLLKTPLLGDLPFLGQLFRQTVRTTKHTTLVIFITPHRIGS